MINPLRKLCHDAINIARDENATAEVNDYYFPSDCQFTDIAESLIPERPEMLQLLMHNLDMFDQQPDDFPMWGEATPQNLLECMVKETIENALYQWWEEYTKVMTKEERMEHENNLP